METFMQSSRWRNIAEAVGIAAIVASLIFVGLQMKQSHEIALSAAYQSRTETLVDFLTASATDEVVRSAMAKNFSGVNDFTPDERFAAEMMARAGIALMQNSHYQYAQGYLDEEHWRSIRMLIKQQLQMSITRELLLHENIRPSFRLIVEEVDRELSAEADAP
jgi:hypothetical protein